MYGCSMRTDTGGAMPQRPSKSVARAGDNGTRNPASRESPRIWDLDSTVAGLRHSRDVAHNIRHEGVARQLPSRTALAEVINGLSTALFPTHYGRPDLHQNGIDDFVRAKLHDALGVLVEQIRLSLPLAASDTAFEAASAERVA